METQTSTKTPTAWSDRSPEPVQPVHTRRTAPDILDLVEDLKAHPRKWAVYSTHQTRGAARQRIYVLRNSSTFSDLPVEFRTIRKIPGDTKSPVQILVRWVGEG